MKSHLIEIRDSETHNAIIVDMEGPYHPKKTKIGEHIYGHTLYIEGIPYHFEKYIPTKEELERFKKDNEGEAQISKGGFLYRLVPFIK